MEVEIGDVLVRSGGVADGAHAQEDLLFFRCKLFLL